MRFSTCLLATLVALSACPVGATQIFPLRYDHVIGNNGTYPDTGYQQGVDHTGELIDGVTESLAWGPGLSISAADVVPLVGWLSNNPTLRFTFDQPVAIDQVVAFFADSNDHAGVGLPSSISLSTPSGFSQSFTINETPFAGAAVPLVLDGFSVVTNEITLTAIRQHSWTMLSEVQFFQQVPEPASWLLILAAGTVWRAKRGLRNQQRS